MKHFRLEEFNCTHTNKNEMDTAFLAKLDELREICGFPFRITSGYRDATHPSEVVKAAPGTGTHLPRYRGRHSRIEWRRANEHRA